MADLSQIPTGQLLQMLQAHPDAQQPQAPPQPVAPSTEVPKLPPEYHGYQSLMKSPAEIEEIRKSGRNNIMALPFAAIPGGKLMQTATGGISGAITAANDPDPSVGKTIAGGGIGALTGLVGSTLAPKIIKGGEALVGRVMGTTPKVAEAPAAAELRKVGSAGYKASEGAGVIIAQPRFKQFSDELQGVIAEHGISKRLHPDALNALQDIQDAADKGNITLKGVDLLRQNVNDVLASTKPRERELGGLIKDHLDDFLDTLGPSDVVTGDAEAGVKELVEARANWAKMRKGEEIDGLIQRAGIRAGQFSGSGYENALRTEFRSMALNTKKMRRYSKEEQDAIKKVSMGGPVENGLRLLGKLAPTGVVSGGIGTGIGYAIGGPVGAVAVPAAGAASRVGATAMTSRNANLASELMRRGPQAAPQAANVNPKTLAITNALGNAPAPGLSAIALSRLLEQPVNNPR